MKKDITYCAAQECPSTKCRINVKNNKFEPHEIISMADFASVCRFYIGWVVRTENEYNGISCEECEVAKYHNLEDDDTPCQNCEEPDANETL